MHWPVLPAQPMPARSQACSLLRHNMPPLLPLPACPLWDAGHLIAGPVPCRRPVRNRRRMAGVAGGAPAQGLVDGPPWSHCPVRLRPDTLCAAGGQFWAGELLQRAWAGRRLGGGGAGRLGWAQTAGAGAWSRTAWVIHHPSCLPGYQCWACRSQPCPHALPSIMSA